MLLLGTEPCPYLACTASSQPAACCTNPALPWDREAQECLMPECQGEQRGCWLLVQSQREHGPDCWDQRTALIYLPSCLFTASELPASHCELSLLCSPSSCGIPSMSLSWGSDWCIGLSEEYSGIFILDLFLCS